MLSVYHLKTAAFTRDQLQFGQKGKLLKRVLVEE